MFHIIDQGQGHVAKPQAPVAMPMEKFFDMNENPLTTGLDLSTVDSIGEKAKGRRVLDLNLYLTEDRQIRLKTKGSIKVLGK